MYSEINDATDATLIKSANVFAKSGLWSFLKASTKQE